MVDEYTEFEHKLMDFRLVDVKTIDSSIQVFVRYAIDDNFLGHVLYKEINHAFLLPEMANKVSAVQKRLKNARPDCSLLIYDTARLLSVQREMCNSVKGRGVHNYGAAVDITIVYSRGKPLPMGSDHDYFGPEARIDHEDELLADSLITHEELANRRLLRSVMTQSGCITCISEWWHFNMMPSARAKAELKVIDFQ